jgi:uncharacterized protein
VADGAVELVLSPAILDEYQRIYARLTTGQPKLEARHPVLDLLAYSTLVPDSPVEVAITQDPDDDKFLRCARDAGAVLVSGDRHLLEVSGWAGVRVITPRTFLDQFSREDT